VDIVLKHDAKLPKGHQTWQLNEVNALIWPSPAGIGIMDQAAFDRTVQISIDSKVLKAAPTGTAFRNDLAQQALAALGSADTKGAAWQKATVTLTQDGK
jgi:NitT/TauT family transport system substrate-binding protein